jgi:hypothetical protein
VIVSSTGTCTAEAAVLGTSSLLVRGATLREPLAVVIQPLATGVGGFFTGAATGLVVFVGGRVALVPGRALLRLTWCRHALCRWAR